MISSLLATPFFPQRASTVSGSVDHLYFALLCISGFFTVLIFGLIIWFSIRYRHSSKVNRRLSGRGQLALELAWTGIPAIIGVSVFVWATRVYVNMTQVPASGLEVYVVAKQWMWKLQHAEGPREINELHVPVGTNVRLLMTSEDVIHSFFVPAFRMKRDVLPGRYESAWFNATRTGQFQLFCAEYCGTQHSRMTGRIIVMTPADYAKWVAANNAEKPAVAGEKLFGQYGCSRCHNSTEPNIAPSLSGLYGQPVVLADGSQVLASEDYLRESILTPKAKIAGRWSAVMPTYQDQLKAEQVLQLVAFIKTLSSQPKERAQ